MTPTDRKYAKTHEWVKMEGTVALVGITDHAQEALGDITFVERAPNGKKVEQGKECGVIESVKAASDIYAPLSGEVMETNAVLDSNPGLVNEDPYGKGWILKLKNVDAAQMSSLLDAAAYEKTIEEEK
jgi:glycine cleavage system H protein